ncbi:DUF3305 domain-containing protein [Methylophaga sp.]|uniref:DUF3305 domain-containing protein n=1 Tax=Methylophaga sp. TaxID=2024840 RepID=UPI003F69564E
MLDTPSDQFAVTAVLLRKPSVNRWQKNSWLLLGTLPGLTESSLTEASEQGDLVYLTEMQLKLYKQHCDAYYVNLMSEQPKVYLVCSEESGELAPMLATVDFDEAASHMETGQTVLDAPLADALCVWLEHFVIFHYKPTPPKKRKRRKWHDADRGDAK